LVLACDGVWDVMTNQVAFSTCYSGLPPRLLKSYDLPVVPALFSTTCARRWRVCVCVTVQRLLSFTNKEPRAVQSTAITFFHSCQPSSCLLLVYYPPFPDVNLTLYTCSPSPPEIRYCQYTYSSRTFLFSFIFPFSSFLFQILLIFLSSVHIFPLNNI
jgi:hypothetical protein